MRSARMLLATATATAALVVSAPTAFAALSGDWEHDKSSYSKEHDEDSSHDKLNGGIHTGGGALVAVKGDGRSGEHDEGEYKEESGEEFKGEDECRDECRDEDKRDREHGKPNGGIHTGGGALAAVKGDGRSGEHDEDEYKEESGEEFKGEDECRDECRDEDKRDREHGKPNGGIHTGGGALAAVKGDGRSGEHDKDEYKDEDEGDKGWEREKPSGGVHTGGGGLSDPSLSGGGLAALAVLGAGAYALRRKKASGSVA
ncbi:hypothetical protein [Streptomyces incanus]